MGFLSNLLHPGHRDAPEAEDAEPKRDPEPGYATQAEDQQNYSTQGQQDYTTADQEPAGQESGDPQPESEGQRAEDFRATEQPTGDEGFATPEDRDQPEMDR